jgi:hypothetical protein
MLQAGISYEATYDLAQGTGVQDLIFDNVKEMMHDQQ